MADADFIRCKDAEMSEEGRIRAVVAKIGTTNMNGLKYLTGVLGAANRQDIIVSEWNHSATFIGGPPPVGSGEVYEKNGYVYMDAQLFMDTREGKRVYSVLKGLGDRAEYSVSVMYDGQEFEVVREGDTYIREISYAQMREVSPVDVGADKFTGTLDLSKHKTKEEVEPEVKVEGAAHNIFIFEILRQMRQREVV